MARPIYLLIPIIIIYFFSSAILKIVQLTRRAHNKSLELDLKVIGLHLMIVIIMFVFITADTVAQEFNSYAVKNKWHKENVKYAKNVTDWLRIITQPVVPMTFLYFFATYGDKKSVDLNNTLMRSSRIRTSSKVTVKTGDSNELEEPLRPSLDIDDSDLISVEGTEDGDSIGLDISNEELMLRAEIFSNFLKDANEDLFKDEEPNF